MKKGVIIALVVAILVVVIAVVVLTTGKKQPAPVVVESGEKVVTVTSGEKEEKPKVEEKETNPYVANIPNEIVDAYKEKVMEIEEKHKKEQEELLKKDPNYDLTMLEKLKYDLIFFDGDDIPELVVTLPGYRTTLYTYASASGKVVNTMRENETDDDEYGWPFGAGGNHGYDYIPRENVIRNENADHAGMVLYVTYYELDGKMLRLVSKYGDSSLYMGHFEDKNNNGELDENEVENYVEETKFYKDSKQITEAEWDSYQIYGDYEEMIGKKSFDEIMPLLNSLINTK